MGIITAAAGRRDGYQVPIALAQSGLLAAHITDHYLSDSLVPLFSKLAQNQKNQIFATSLKRHHPDLPSLVVHCSRRLMLTKVAQGIYPPLKKYWCDDQDPISWSALRLARQHDAALLLHMGYAHHAFMAEPLENRKRGLVQYHPHVGESSRILLDDLNSYPFLTDARDQISVDVQDHTNQEELERADLVICNSQFSAQTCISLGIHAERINVIPFGIDIPVNSRPRASSSQNTQKCNFLFVGSGLHRKGLHHLLDAWKRARLQHSKLTLVCRYIDPQIRVNFDLPSSVQLLTAVSSQHLDELYRHSHVFVMPSLVEGFGYVYLEALARGCFCLGTKNTGLPDISTADSAMLVPAANPAILAKALAKLEEIALTDGFDRQAIINCAVSWSWARFRHNLVDVAQKSLLLNKQ